REKGERPRMITADALVICPETQKLILHRRGAKDEGVDAYPGKLHVFGGAYIANSVAADRSGFRSTIAREILEETQATVSCDHLPPTMLTQEFTPDLNFVSLMALGLPLSPSAVDKL